jgi:hypothetical protein
MTTARLRLPRVPEIRYPIARVPLPPRIQAAWVVAWLRCGGVHQADAANAPDQTRKRIQPQLWC